MPIRIWSKKIVSVLRYYRSNPHVVLFGVTGDLDNLGVYVASNGRAKAEVVVDSYNRVIGSLFYQFMSDHPHLFYESHFLPAGEEVFILGTCADEDIAKQLFSHLRDTSVPEVLVECGLGEDVSATDVSFGCSTLNALVSESFLDEMLARVEGPDVLGANRLYIAVLQQIRNALAVQLDLEKFSNISEDPQVAILLRNIVYTKTLQYKASTKGLIVELGERLATDQETYNRCIRILGRDYGLPVGEHESILAELERV